MSDGLENNGLIATIIGGLVGATWIGNVITQYIKTKAESNKEILLLSEELKDVTEEKKRLTIEVEALTTERDIIIERIKSEVGNRRALEQKLASIEVAFNITFLHLKTHLGPDDPILAELKKHIDKGTGNLS